MCICHDHFGALAPAKCPANFICSRTLLVEYTITRLLNVFSPELTWRDIQHLIVRSSKPLNPPWRRSASYSERRSPSWRVNNANLRGTVPVTISQYRYLYLTEKHKTKGQVAKIYYLNYCLYHKYNSISDL